MTWHIQGSRGVAGLLWASDAKAQGVLRICAAESLQVTWVVG